MPRMLMSLTCPSAKGFGRGHELGRASGHVRRCGRGHVRGCGRGSDQEGGLTDSHTDSLDVNDNYIDPEVPTEPDPGRRRDSGRGRGREYQMQANAPALDSAQQPDSAETVLME